uniref:Exocyst complex component Sec8 n=1 Tax=Macrostomum lignano TaxID=282301 RepID=A0A1I8FIK8_9PLAT
IQQCNPFDLVCIFSQAACCRWSPTMFLLEIIRDLIRNPNPENKKHLENRIEEQFSHSSHNLDKLLNKQRRHICHHQPVRRRARPSLQSQSRGGAVRGDLARCCQLLQLKRDELRSLYTGHVELHKSVKLLTRIRHVGSAPARIQSAGKPGLTRLYALDPKGASADFDGLASKDLSQVPAPEHGESVNSILCLLERACCLDKLPQTVQSVLDNLMPSLRDIAIRHTGLGSGRFANFQTNLLAHLEQVAFRHTVLAKRLNLLVLRSPALAQSPSVAAYSEENPALAAIVSQLRDLLGDYLDVRGENLSYESAAAAGPAQFDLNQLLGRRKIPARPAGSVLFRFAYSSHAPSAPPVRLQPPQRPPLLPAPISPTAPAPRSKKTAPRLANSADR